MNKQKWIFIDGVYYPTVESELYDCPGMGIFQVVVQKTPHGQRVGLLKLADKFELPSKVYDLGTKDVEDRIIKTWESDTFKKTGKNLGIIYNGEKGAGKTVGAKILCNRLNLPVIIVPTNDDCLLEFLQALNFDCCIFIDEAEKIFKGQNDEGQLLLKLIDGVFSTRRKLYILTTNTLTLDRNLISRPGRIRYIKEFAGMTPKAIEEMIYDKLEDPTKADIIRKFIKNKVCCATMDIVENIITEVNIHGDLPENKLLNIDTSKNTVTLLELSIYNKKYKDLSESDLRKIKADIENTIKQPISYLFDNAADGLSYTTVESFAKHTNFVLTEDIERCIELIRNKRGEIMTLQDLLAFSICKTLNLDYNKWIADNIDFCINMNDRDFFGDKMYPGLVDSYCSVRVDEIYDDNMIKLTSTSDKNSVFFGYLSSDNNCEE